jgi:protein SCO1/2
VTVIGLSLLALLFVGPPQPQAEGGPRPRRARDAAIDFTLTERSGRQVTSDDLAGKVWIASFIITPCPDGKCPQVTRTVQRLQEELAGRKGLLLVTFVVHSDQRELTEKELYGARPDPDRWLLLTGDESEIDRLLRAFHLRGPANKPGERDHAQKLILVDQKGNVRGYYDGLEDTVLDPPGHFEANLRKLRKQVDEVLAEDRPWWMPRDFPAFNAGLNALAAMLILTGWVAIRTRMTRLHIGCMVTALAVSALFLASYLYYHLVIKAGVATRFRDQAPAAPDWVAYLYAGILISHTILAVFVTPMALVSAFLGLRNKLRGHVRLARWTMPIWLYVSVTGVVVYWMLYRLYPL